MNRSEGSRWQIAIGVVVGAGLGLLLLYLLASSATRAAWSSVRERSRIISTQAITSLIERAGGEGDDVRQLADAWRREHPEIMTLRVVDVENRSLEASNVKADLEEGEPPRRLARAEKSLFDTAQRIRAATETNIQEGSSRKEEIEVVEQHNGDLTISSPFMREGEVAGIVEVTSRPRTEAAKASITTVILIGLAVLLVGVVSSLIVARSRGLALVLASLAVIGGIVAYSQLAARAVEKEHYRISATVASMRSGEEQRAAKLASQLLGGEQPVTSAKWDVDRFRRPVSSAVKRGETRQVFSTPLVATIAIISFAIFAFFGFGWAGRTGAALRKHRQAYAYTLPALLGMLLLVFFPFIYGIILSFTQQNIYNTNKPLTEIWVGFRNYIEILGDFDIFKRTAEGLVFNYENFYWTLGVTVAWTISNVAIGVSLGLLLALILNTKGLALRPVYRVLLILPWAMPNYITSLIWKGMFHPQFGVVNQVLQIFGAQPISWFEHPFTSFAAAVVTNGWLSFPFMMVISLGALQSIPADLYEAARVDGATRWQQFTSITLPSMKPALVPAVILSVVWTFNMFNIIYLVNAGEPAKSTEILITQAYKIAFEQYRYGYAAAYATVIFIILFAYGTFQNRVTKATEAIG